MHMIVYFWTFLSTFLYFCKFAYFGGIFVKVCLLGYVLRMIVYFCVRLGIFMYVCLIVYFV